jgi:hypothetical protein
MYELINGNIDTLLCSINRKKDIEPYIWLLETLPGVDVTNHPKYQQVYRDYWKLNPARLDDKFVAAYFSLLQELKNHTEISVEVVSRNLLKTPSHTGRYSLQFSFASKLVHMLKPDHPVYDKMVDDFFFFPTGTAKEAREAKLARLLTSYRFLFQEYERILEQELLSDAIIKFRKYFHVCNGYTNQKIIDTLIWKFVSLLRSGAIINSVIVYT